MTPVVRLGITGTVENIISSSHKSAVPVYDAVTVQEHERRRHLGGVETGSSLVKLPGALDLKHQVAPVHVLHDEEEAVLAAENTEGLAGRAKLTTTLCVKGLKSRLYLLETLKTGWPHSSCQSN